MKLKLMENESFIADKGYRGADVAKMDEFPSSYTSLIRARHETLNSRIKKLSGGCSFSS